MPETGNGPGSLRVVFMGTPALAVATLDALAARHDLMLVVTQPDREVGRGRQLRESPVKRRALELGAPVHQPATLREPGSRAPLVDARPDVAVVVAYGLLLPPEVLEIPRLGCVNLHASLLPRHRGASPIQAAILAGDATSGVTTMLMDEGLDTGPILLQAPVPVRDDDTAGSLGQRLATVGAELVVETLEGLVSGTLQPRPQDPAAATTTRLIRKEDGQIDWSAATAVIERQVRAFQPWPSAYTFVDGTRLQVWAAEAGAETEAAPGTVVRADEHLEVACGDGRRLRLLQVQRAGGRPVSAADFLRGFPVELGSALGAAGR